MCEFWSAQCELCGCCCSEQRVLCEICLAHQVLAFLSLVDVSALLVHETVCSRLERWHAPRLKKISCVHLIPHFSSFTLLPLYFLTFRLLLTFYILLYKRIIWRTGERKEKRRSPLKVSRTRRSGRRCEGTGMEAKRENGRHGCGVVIKAVVRDHNQEHCNAVENMHGHGCGYWRGQCIDGRSRPTLDKKSTGQKSATE